MTVTFPGIGSAAAGPGPREAPRGYKEGRSIALDAEQVRQGGSRSIDTALHRLRQFLESNVRPEPYARPGTYLNILV
jgi:hypothetical protein